MLTLLVFVWLFSARFAGGQFTLTVNPSPTVFGGSSVTLTWPDDSGGSITYRASMNGTLLAQTTTNTDSTTWAVSVPSNLNIPLTLYVTNDDGSDSRTVTAYAPTIFPLAPSKFAKGQTLTATVAKLSTAGAFTVYVNSSSISTQSGTNSTVLYLVTSLLPGVKTLSVSEGANLATALFTVSSTGFAVNPSPSVFGGSSVTVTLTYPPYTTSITYYAEIGGTSLTQAISTSTATSWIVSVPSNTNALLKLYVTNSLASDTSTVSVYAPTISALAPSTFSQGQTLTATVGSLSTAGAFTVYVNGNSISTQSGTNSTVLYSVTSPLSGVKTLSVSEGANLATALFTVMLTGFDVNPSPSVFGGSSVTVTVTYSPYATSITYSAKIGGASLAEATSTSTDTTWVVSVPSNTIAPLTLYVFNSLASNTSTVSVYAPTISALALSTFAQGQVLTATIGSLSTAGAFTVLVNASSISTQSGTNSTVLYSATSPLSGVDTLSIAEGLNLATVLFTVSPTGFNVLPSPSVFGGSLLTVTVTYPPYAASITYSAKIGGASLTEATSTSTATTWVVSVPSNTNASLTLYVTNSLALATSTITAYAPTISPLATSTFAQGQTLTATVGSLSTAGAFTVYVNGNSISTQSGTNSTVLYSATSPLSGVKILSIAEGLNLATVLFTVSPTGFNVVPSPSVFGGSLVTVTVTYPPYTTSITYSAEINGTAFTSTVSDSLGTTWSVTAPSNTNAPLQVYVTNSLALATSTITAYAPIISPLAPSTFSQGQTLTATVGSLSTAGAFTVYVNGNSISTQSGTNSTVLYSVTSPLSGVKTLSISEGANLVTALFTVTPTGFDVNPSPSVFGGSSVTITVLYPPYSALITYSASLNGSLYAQTTTTSTATNWTLSVPSNVNTGLTLYVVNSLSSGTSTVSVYAPTISALAPSTFIQGQTLTATIGSLSAAGTFTVYVNNSSISTQSGANSTVLYSVTSPLSGVKTLSISEGANLATALFTVTPTGFVVNPSPSVFGGSSVIVTVTYPPYAASITYSADINGTLLASAVSPSTGTNWSVSMPRNINELISVHVSNAGVTDSSTLTLYAPTISQSNDGIIVAVGQLVVTPTSIDTASPYSVTFGNGIYNFTNTISGTAASFTLPIPNNYIGNFVLTLAQAPNEQVLTYTVVKPIPGYARNAAFQRLG